MISFSFLPAQIWLHHYPLVSIILFRGEMIFEILIFIFSVNLKWNYSTDKSKKRHFLGRHQKSLAIIFTWHVSGSVHEVSMLWHPK